MEAIGGGGLRSDLKEERKGERKGESRDVFVLVGTRKLGEKC